MKSTMIIPDLTGLPYVKAVELLRSMSVRNVMCEIRESGGQWDTVIEQRPAAGSPIENDTAILTVSGPDLRRFLPLSMSDNDDSGFLSRFLRIPAHALVEIDRSLLVAGSQLSIFRCPEHALSGLTSLLADLFELPDLRGRERSVVAEYCRLRARRGTARAIREAVRVVCGFDCVLVENATAAEGFRVGLGRTGISRIDARTDPARCFVLIPSKMPDLNEAAAIHRVVESLKPAGTFHVLDCSRPDGDRHSRKIVRENVFAAGITRTGRHHSPKTSKMA